MSREHVFQPNVVATERPDGRYDLSIDWSDSYLHAVDSDDLTGDPILWDETDADSKRALAAQGAMDEFVRTLVVPDVIDGPPDAEPAVLDMGEVVRLLQVNHGVHALVEATGGGVATIFAGRTRYRDGDPDDTEWAAICGPGSWGRERATISLAECWVSADDLGETAAVDAHDVGVRTEADLALLIATQATMPFGQSLPGPVARVLRLPSSL